MVLQRNWYCEQVDMVGMCLVKVVGMLWLVCKGGR